MNHNLEKIMLNSNSVLDCSTHSEKNIDQHFENIPLKTIEVEGNNNEREGNKTEINYSNPNLEKSMLNSNFFLDHSTHFEKNVDQNKEKMGLKCTEIGEAERNDDEREKNQTEINDSNPNLENIVLNTNSFLDHSTHLEKNVDQNTKNVSLKCTEIVEAEGNNDEREKNKPEVNDSNHHQEKNMLDSNNILDCNTHSEKNVDQNLANFHVKSTEVGEAEGNNGKEEKDKNKINNSNSHLEKFMLNSNNALDCSTHSEINVDQHLENIILKTIEFGEPGGNNDKRYKSKTENNDSKTHQEKLMLNSNTVLNCSTHSEKNVYQNLDNIGLKFTEFNETEGNSDNGDKNKNESNDSNAYPEKIMINSTDGSDISFQLGKSEERQK